MAAAVELHQLLEMVGDLLALTRVMQTKVVVQVALLALLVHQAVAVVVVPLHSSQIHLEQD
jgi:hypothetical protein